jgi:hypothetical protein
MTTTSQKIADMLLLLGMGLIILITGFMLIIPRLGKQSFDYSAFIQTSSQLSETLLDHFSLDQAEFLYTYLLTLSLDEVNTRYQELIPHFPTQTSHVTSSYAQVKEMAKIALTLAQQTFATSNVQIINAVYTTNSGFSALLGKPQPYLFFAVNADKSAILSIEITPAIEQTHTSRLFWSIEQSKDLLATQQAVQKLLVVFNEIKR